MSNTAYGVLKNRATGLEIPGEALYNYGGSPDRPYVHFQ